MKGLILKDWYMMKKYCRSYCFIAAVFLAVSLIGNSNLFFVFYPCMLCGMIPLTLYGYDERSHWVPYSGTMPYTRTQIVSVKYLMGLFAQITTLVVTGTAHAIKMAAAGDFIPGEFTVLMLLMFILSTLTSSISLPPIFRLGMEKGRAAYYVTVGFICGAGILASGFFKDRLTAEINTGLFLPILAVVGIAIYMLSWHLSIVFYQKRELGGGNE